ncbi:MAG: hypothetical protein HWE27_18525 [Gammaproteobacteria bacterium]|nr:hypothetical protein [Gammaproteobacteria bacterium]
MTTFNYFTFSFSIVFISWVVGLIFDALLQKAKFYQALDNLNFIESRKLNKWMGLDYFKWTVKNTFFRFFNMKLNLNSTADIDDLHILRKEMTKAELSHLLAFLFMAVFSLVLLLKGKFLFALIMLLVNILMNLYPSLLQQQNKRRIDKLIKRYS